MATKNFTWDPSLNTTHISDNLHAYEAARTGFFVLEVYHLTGNEDPAQNLLQPTYEGEITSADEASVGIDVGIDSQLPGAADRLRLNVIKCPVPHFNVETMEYRRGNDVIHFAGKPTWDGGTIVVDDIVGVRTKDILLAWLYKAYNPHTRKGGRMKDYKKYAELYEYTQDYELVRKWAIEGIFITKLQEDEFDRENDGARKISADFVFDRAVVMDVSEESED